MRIVIHQFKILELEVADVFHRRIQFHLRQRTRLPRQLQLRLLDVDSQLVIPVGKKVRVLTNSSDVIHSFFIPAFGIQRYAIPGRTIETWMEADQVGTFYGECNQICGQDHSRMPISVRAVSEEDFKTWAASAKKSASADQLRKIASR